MRIICLRVSERNAKNNNLDDGAGLFSFFPFCVRKDWYTIRHRPECNLSLSMTWHSGTGSLLHWTGALFVGLAHFFHRTRTGTLLRFFDDVAFGDWHTFTLDWYTIRRTGTLFSSDWHTFFIGLAHFYIFDDVAQCAGSLLIYLLPGEVSITIFKKFIGFKGGYLDFSHLAELKKIYITEIYMKKQYKSSRIKNHKITKKKKKNGWGSIKRLRSLLIYF